MLWVFVLVAGCWLVWLLILPQEPGRTLSARERFALGWLKLREALTPAARSVARHTNSAVGWMGRSGRAGTRRVVTEARRVLERRDGASRTAMRFGVRTPAPPRAVVRVRGDGLRSRMVALIQLILFVVLVSALFAGAVAAATLRFTHLGA
jgi:hypothetical protein